MQTRSILILLAACLLALVIQNAQARSNGPHPWPGAPKMFKKLMHESANIRPGNYRIRSAHNGLYMTMFSKGNNINVKTSKNGGGSDMGPEGQVFRIAHHKNSHYKHLFSIHRPNYSGNDKCISAGYSRTADIFGIMYMCRVESNHSGAGGVTSPQSPIKYDKQLWIFIPGKHGTYKIIAVAHLYSYKPRCLYPSHRTGYGAMKPHWYQGLALDECILDNKKGVQFNWHLERVK